MTTITLLPDVGANDPIFAYTHAYLASLSACLLTQVGGQKPDSLAVWYGNGRCHLLDEAEGSPCPGSGSATMALAQNRRTYLSSYVGRS